MPHGTNQIWLSHMYILAFTTQVHAHCTSYVTKLIVCFTGIFNPKAKVSLNYISKMLIMVLQVLIQLTEEDLNTVKKINTQLAHMELNRAQTQSRPFLKCAVIL